MQESPEKLLKLEFGGGLFVCNVGTKNEAKDRAKKRGGSVRKYGIDISTFDPETGKVTGWKFKGGFSVWMPLSQEAGGGKRPKFSSKFTFTKSTTLRQEDRRV